MTAILAVLIWAQWPSSALWVIGLLVGINLLFTGWSLCMVAIAARAHPGQAVVGTREARGDVRAPR